MVPAVGLEPMRKFTKACVYAALRRPTPALIGTNWYDLHVVRYLAGWRSAYRVHHAQTDPRQAVNV